MRRRAVVRGWLVVVVAFCVGAPSASAQAPAPDCEPVESPSVEFLCIGERKLEERAAAECRRAGDAAPADAVSDPACFPPNGQRVDRAKVAAHATSWLHGALAFQFALGHDVPFRDAPWIGTHNSYNSTGEFPTLSHTDSNQQLSLVDQLALDVRSLEIDVHWSPSPRAGGAPAPVVCHAEAQGGVHVGCTGERLLGEVLGDVAGWLNRPENRREVLLLYLEDHLDRNHAAARQVLDATLQRDGRSLVYPAGAHDGDCRSLPLALTRRAVLDSGAQVVIVGDCGAGWNSRVFAWGGRIESRPNDYTPDNCGGVVPADYESRLVRFYEDSTFLTAAAAQVPGAEIASADDGIDPATAATMTRCGVDLFGFDQLLPDDGRLESVVWSWAPGHPSASGGACAVQGAGGRWTTGDCAQPRRAACRVPGGGWTVTGPAVAFAAAEPACRAAGGEFDLPRTGYDNARLRDAAGSGEVWIAHRAFPEDTAPGPGGPGSGGPGAGTPGAVSPGAAGGAPSGRASPAPRRVSRAAAAGCRLLPVSRRRAGAAAGRPARRRVLCRVRLARSAGALARLTLTRGRATYARAVRRLGRGGGALATRTLRPLRPGAYILTISLSGETRALVRRRVVVS